MKLSPRDRLIATVAGCVLAVVVLAGVLIYPQVMKLAPLNRQIAVAQSNAQAAKMKLAERQGFRDRAISNNAKWLKLMNQVPDNPDLASFIIELQDTAFKSGVQIVAVSPAAPLAKGSYSTVGVTLEILGSWADTIDFMEALMNLDRGVRIMKSSSTLTSNASTLTRRNSSLPRYPVNTGLTLETYLIPSSVASAAPGATTP